MSGGSQIFFGAATPACWTVQYPSCSVIPCFVSPVPASTLQEISTNIAAGRVAGSPQRHPALDWLYLDGSYAALEALLALWRQLKLGRALEGNILAQATNTTWAWMVT